MISSIPNRITKPLPGVRANPSHPLSQGLIGYWLFNEGSGSQAYDISGHGNHGTLKNMLPNVQGSGWGGSMSGGGLQLDGSNDYVTTPVNPNSNIIGDAKPFTIGIRAYPRDVVSNNHLVSAGWWNGDDRRFFISLVNSAWAWGIGNKFNESTGVTATSDVWQDIVLVYEGGLKDIKMYLDGTEKYSSVYDGTGNFPDRQLFIGALNTNKSPYIENYFDGIIDSVRIYNRALSAWEAKQLHINPFCNLLVPRRWYMPADICMIIASSGQTKPNPGVMLNPLHPLSKGLIASWLFNEGAGSRVNDISGHGNHGTLTNMSVNVQGSGWGGSDHGGGVNFDGSGDYVDVDVPIPNSFSIVGKVRIGDDTQDSGLWGGNDELQMWFDSAVTNHFAVGIKIADSSWSVRYGDVVSNEMEWYHVVITYNSTTDITKMYVNGEQDGADLSAIPRSSLIVEQIGMAELVNSKDMTGSFDFASVYDRVLSAIEVKTLYRNPFCNLLAPRRWYMPAVGNPYWYYNMLRSRR